MQPCIKLHTAEECLKILTKNWLCSAFWLVLVGQVETCAPVGNRRSSDAPKCLDFISPRKVFEWEWDSL
jgi:hypothetical protein